jgi:hypothetical protein
METMIKEIIEDLFAYGNGNDGGMVQSMIDGMSYSYSGSTIEPNAYVQVDCNPYNQGNGRSVYIEFEFSTLVETDSFDRDLDTLKDTITEELEFWIETNSLNRGSLKNLGICLVRTFFLDGFGIDLFDKEFVELCKWESMYRD